MKLKVLIIGSAGQVGGALADIFKRNKDFEIIAADKVSSRGAYTLDITEESQVRRFFSKVKPQAVILPAALTNADAIEDQRALAYSINVRGVENVVKAAKENLAKLVYFSSAYIFDGKRGNYKENDKPHPINYYAQTKLEAERIVQRELNDYLIIRTIWVFDFGYDKKNFIVRLLGALKNKEMVKVPDDQWGNPTLAINLASAVEELVRKNKKGVYHIAGSEKMNKYQWAVKTAKYFNLDHKLIMPISTKALKQKAARPKKDDLNVSKAQKELETKLFSLKESLALLRH